MSFQIRINGTPFSLWESATVQRSLDANSGMFRFTNSSTTPIGDYPVKAGDFAEVLVFGKRKIAGFIDEITENQQEGLHVITVGGRDNIQDLIDSSVPDDAKVTEGPISLKALCEKVIAALGAKITVFDQSGGIDDFTDDDLQAAAAGDSCMLYLVSFARKRQVYLVPDGSGALIIYRPDKNNKASGMLIHKRNNKTNNVKSYSVVRSLQNRFNKYVMKSQDNFGFDPFADYSDTGTARNGEALDTQVRSTRYLEIVAEESMTDTECTERAKEEANMRRAAGLIYSATVAGTTQPDGTVWDFGQFVNVIDEFAGIAGEFLIKAVEYSVDVRQGTRTILTLVPPDAYQVIATPTAQTVRKAKTGTAFQNMTPKEQEIILRYSSTTVRSLRSVQ